MNGDPEKATHRYGDISASVRVYTDGSSRGRAGGPGGWGVVMVFRAPGVEEIELSGSQGSTTNQRMEVLAAAEALEWLARIPAVEGRSPAVVYSDSTYLVNCMRRKWHEGWLKNGWKNSKNQPIANRDLWVRLLDSVEALAQLGVTVEFRKVRGHSTNEYNNRADELAVTARLARAEEVL